MNDRRGARIDGRRDAMGKKSDKDVAVRDRMKRKEYEPLLRDLQIELLKLQRWVLNKGKRVVVLFEGRDGAGKGGTILRVTQHLNPRTLRKVALTKPNEMERGEWCFQRYVEHLPTTGEIVLFDRSWYNRAGVERVMGFCTRQEYDDFMRSVPQFESMLVNAGISLLKFWLDISSDEQKRRLASRKEDPLKRWKLSPMDDVAQEKWDDYTTAKREMFRRTHLPHAPWTVVRSDDKKLARVNCIRALLQQFDYDKKDEVVACAPDRHIVGSATDPAFGE